MQQGTCSEAPGAGEPRPQPEEAVSSVVLLGPTCFSPAAPVTVRGGAGSLLVSVCEIVGWGEQRQWARPLLSPGGQSPSHLHIPWAVRPFCSEAGVQPTADRRPDVNHPWGRGPGRWCAPGGDTGINAGCCRQSRPAAALCRSHSRRRQGQGADHNKVTILNVSLTSE